MLLAPAAVGGVDAERGGILTGLTRQQVEDSPSSDQAGVAPAGDDAARLLRLGAVLGRAAARRQPRALLGHRRARGGARAGRRGPGRQEVAGRASAEERDLHLRSAREVAGYRVAATDGEIGRVDDFLIDDRDWAIEPLGIDTGNWLPGRKVVVSPGWLRGVDWAGHRIGPT